MTAALLFVSTFAVVFALGSQSLFVNSGRYVAAFCNSAAIGFCHLALYKLAPGSAGMEIVAYLAGGPFGIVAAMYVFRHLQRR